MTKESKIGFGLVLLVVASIIAINAHEKSAIRNGYMALQHFRLLSADMLAEARVVMAEKTGIPAQSVMRDDSGTSQLMGAVEFSETWEITPKDPVTNNAGMQIIARAIETELSRMVEGEKATLGYYYPRMQIKLEVSPVDSKAFDKQGILISLKCSN